VGKIKIRTKIITKLKNVHRVEDVDALLKYKICKYNIN
jgi:hypothetical protein